MSQTFIRDSPAYAIRTPLRLTDIRMAGMGPSRLGRRSPNPRRPQSRSDHLFDQRALRVRGAWQCRNDALPHSAVNRVIVRA